MEVREEAPLLGGYDNNDDDIGDHDNVLSSGGKRKTNKPLLRRLRRAWSWWPRLQLKQPRHIALLTCLSIFLWVLSGSMAIIPATRVAEDVFCRRFYERQQGGPGGSVSAVMSSGDGDIPEERCKNPEIQSQMAYLFSFTFTLDSLVGLLVAFPFSVLADRARKPIYVLGTFGQSLNVAWTLLVLYGYRTLRVELILLGPVFQLLGGGLMVALSVLYAMLTDVLDAENRSTWFFFFSLSAQAAGFIGAPLGAKLMELWSPWVPLTIVLMLGPINALLMVFMPETLRLPKTVPPNMDDAADVTLNGSLHRTGGDGWWPEMKTRLRSQLRTLRDSLSIFRSRPMLLGLVTFVSRAPIDGASMGVFIQYYSKRFHRSLAEAGYVLAIRGVLIIVVMGVLLPLLTKLLSRPLRRQRQRQRRDSSTSTSDSSTAASTSSWSPYARDLLLARGSAVCLTVGLVLVAAAPTRELLFAGLAVFTLSSGMGPLCRSLVANFVEPSRTTRVFTLISILESVCALPVGPILAWAFSVGMRAGGALYGLPFLFLALLGLASTVCLFLMRQQQPTPPPLSRPGTAGGSGSGDPEEGAVGLQGDEEGGDASRGEPDGDARLIDDSV
ncbi:major facilitator superfamily domain-containing protein [Xylariales sp. PMI_506]|nr:major facilitator superfamily domain-containing protein [Xylariales sp. PMI_506]